MTNAVPTCCKKRSSDATYTQCCEFDPDASDFNVFLRIFKQGSRLEICLFQRKQYIHCITTFPRWKKQLQSGAGIRRSGAPWTFFIEKRPATPFLKQFSSTIPSCQSFIRKITKYQLYYDICKMKEAVAKSCRKPKIWRAMDISHINATIYAVFKAVSGEIPILHIVYSKDKYILIVLQL